MGLKQITANPTVQAVAAVLLGALSVVGVSSVRGTLGVSADPTTRHGELAVRVDAGGADVTALAAVDPGTTGQVLTVGDAGIPVWRDPSSGGVTLAGTGAVAVYAGDAGTVDGAGAADASVLTLVGGAPQWAAGATQPTSLAAQARADALRRRGPLALRSTGSSGTASTAATPDATPDLALSTSGVIVVYAAQAGGYSSTVFAQSGVWATRGWYLTAQGSAVRLNLMQGTLITVDLDGVVGATGWHAVAWSLPADGLTVRYSVDGAAVTTATPSTTPLTAVPRAVGDTVYIATNGAGSGTTCGVAYLGLWESILADGDLVTLSSTPSAGAPTLPSTPVWEWAAAAFAGVEAVTIDGVVHAITGTPQVWMP